MRRILSLLTIVFIHVAVATAQTGQVSGKISDDNGQPLIGANVVVKGTTIGTISDLDGNYTLSGIPVGSQTLVSSFIGYGNVEKTIEILNGQTLTISFILIEDIAQLDELIVIGYGVQKKSDKTGAVSQIKADEMNGGVITDPMQAIQGKTAGVTITKKGGDPNSGFSVKIRGASGFSSNTEPLYVIDGVPGVDPTTIAPEDIETFNILKDAASTAIYGSRGSNGVVIITTKKGTKESNQIQFGIKTSIDQVANKLDLLTADEIRNYVANNNLDFTDNGANTDWQDEIFRRGITQNYNLNFSGGTEKSNYYASLTQANFEGVMKGTSKDRTIGKINLTHKAFENKLTLSGSMSGTFEQNQYENYDGYDKDDILYQAFQRNPTDPVYDANGDYFQIIRAFNYENPLSVINQVDNIRDAKRFFGNFKADLEIIEGLIGSVNIGYIRDDQESSVFRPQGIYATVDPGYGSKSYENTTQKLIDITGNYVKTFNGVHNLNALAGYSYQESINSAFWANAVNPQSPYMKYNNLGSFVDDARNIGSRKETWKLIGFFGRVQYNYDSKYFASASLRKDGSSKFGANHKWGWFPTLALAWDLQREGFLSNITEINQFKLRGSYGISGNQEIGVYRSQLVFAASGSATDPETGNRVTTYRNPWNANPDLKWEETSEFNLGLDFAIFNSRISGSLEYYNKQTSDLLGEYPVPVPPYLSDKIFANSGSMTNNGVELFVQAHAIERSNFSWKTSLNIGHNKTILKDLGEWVPSGEDHDGYLTGRGLIGDQNYVTGNITDQELAAFYLPVYVGLNNDGSFLYKSVSGGITRELTSAKREIVGTPLPDVEIGWTNNFTFYRNFTFDFSFRSLIGNDVYNATKMFFDSPSLLPQLNALPDAIDWKEKGRTSSAQIADIYVEDGSFLKL
ncbi:MAG: SusC/RagA family TonB-linked outer membrane protein, partial [Salinivirgaceae bacterium]|nr:SusC/RagA family TonB-linked outer membrane protein [Salinivirgaceae bacterium]